MCSRAYVLQVLSTYAATIEAHMPRDHPLKQEKPLPQEAHTLQGRVVPSL